MRNKHPNGVAKAHNDSLACAAELAEHLRAGGALLSSRVPTVCLEDGEVEYAHLDAFGARFYALDNVVWESRTFIAGGPLMVGVTAAASVIGNAGRKSAARAAAAAQWRPLGWMAIVVTSHRLVVFHEGAWHSVWFAGVRHVIPEPGLAGVQILFEADEPYRLTGPHVPYLAVLLVKVLFGEVVDLESACDIAVPAAS